MKFLELLKNYIHISGVGPISRRYFVMNAFDGAMTILGIVLGTYIAGIKEPLIIITAGLSTTLAIGISGFTGTYLVEESERIRSLKELEGFMLKTLKGTLIGKSHKFASFWAAFIGGISPALSSIIALIPYFLAHLGFLSKDITPIFSICTILITIFFLGVFLGSISKRNLLFSGIKLTAVGMVLITILLFLRLI